MNMLRALIALLLLFLAGRVLGRLLRPGHGARSPRDNVPVTRMLRCARCGTFVPAGDAVTEGELDFCSEEHRRLGPAQRT
jgi:uncharacterized protein